MSCLCCLFCSERKLAMPGMDKASFVASSIACDAVLDSVFEFELCGVVIIVGNVTQYVYLQSLQSIYSIANPHTH
jgi:hypothetical protein